MTEVVEILEASLETLGPNGEHWCKGSYAQDTHNLPVPTKDPRAIKFCAVGAVLRQESSFNYSKMRSAEHYLLMSVATESSWRSVADFNDHNLRKFPSVKRAFEKAIELAKEEENSAEMS